MKKIALAAVAVLALFSGFGVACAAESSLIVASARMSLGANVFVDSELPPAGKFRIVDIVEQARQRAENFYGRLAADPRIVLCTTVDRFRKAGGMGLGFSDGRDVLVSPYGASVEIVSHELSHVELASRLGGYAQALAKVPQWFDEGLAVVVSQAPEFSEQAWLDATENGRNAPQLSQLESASDWNRITGESGVNMQLSYGTARREVARWYGAVGGEGLARLIGALNRGESFYVAYWRIENSAGKPAEFRLAALF